MTLSAPTVNYGQAGIVSASLAVPGFSQALTGGGTINLTVDAGTLSQATFTSTFVNGVCTFNVGLLADGTHTLALSYASQTISEGTGGGQLVLLSGGGTGTLTVSQSIYAVNTSASGALTVASNATVNVPGVLQVDSTSASALANKGSVTASSGIQVAGGVSGNGSFTPAPATHVANLSDPLAGIAPPSVSGPSLGAVKLTGGAATISPGIYTSISLTGTASLTMLPGIYVIAGGGFSESGGAMVSGSGVLIYNTGSNYPKAGGSFGAISLSGGGNLTATAAGGSSQLGQLAPFAGLVFFQDRSNTQAMSLSGHIVGGITGAVYAKNAALSLGGGVQYGNSVVVGTISVGGGGVLNALPSSNAYTPDQIRTGYGINNLALNGNGQTIAIVGAYDNPHILDSVDAFDSQFSATASGPTLYQQYGPASTFVTVLNQNGQTAPLPATDPTGAGVANWELESALDVEWVHAIAPGANIVLVEANSQSLGDLMSSVATAAAQPGVSVVSMSWGFTEGQTVLAADEAMYDSYLTTPAGHQGVTFVTSTGDYGTNNPEYPAFSPNVVAVGGTSLTLNADSSYNSETGWGYESAAAGTLIASGGGLSQFEPEPAYQQGVQATGFRTTPDVSFVADPNTGAWIADTYNLGASNPFVAVGGTSLSAPSWAGLFALVNQGRAAAGAPTLNSSSPTEAQQDLYSLSQSDYNVINSGTNGGYNAASGYNLVTGLGTPIANQLVPDMVAGNYPATGQVAPIASNLNVNPGYTGSGSGGTTNVINVFSALVATGDTQAYARDTTTAVLASEPGATRHVTGLLQPSTSTQPAGLFAAPNGSENASGSFVLARRTEMAASAATFDHVGQIRYASAAMDHFHERRASDVFFAGAGGNQAAAPVRSAASDSARATSVRLGKPPRTARLYDTVFQEVSTGVPSGVPLPHGGPTAQPLEDWAGGLPAVDEAGNALFAGIFAGGTLQELARLRADRRGTAEAEKARRSAQQHGRGR
jgi:hypothetical protein